MNALDPKNITVESVAKFTRDSHISNERDFSAWWDSREALIYRSRLAIRGLNKDDTLRDFVRLAFMSGKLAGLIEMRNV